MDDQQNSISTIEIIISDIYDSKSILELCRSIVDKSDPKEIDYLIRKRKILNQETGNAMTVLEYIQYLSLKDRAEDRDYVNEYIEYTYHKLTHIPDNNLKCKNGSIKRQIDCTKFYKRYLDYVTNKLIKGSHKQSVIKQIALCENAFLYFVKTEYKRSKSDVQYKFSEYSRYNWKVNGEMIRNLYMPRIIRGRDRTLWLKANIPQPDPRNPGERERVQQIINATPFHTFLHYVKEEKFSSNETDDTHSLSKTFLAILRDKGIVEALAREKTHPVILKKQRTSIRNLKEAKLREMIYDIFHMLETKHHCANAIAEKYDLSVATFSRFASTRWNKEPSDSENLPDLWNNLSELLSHDEEFMTVAREYGYV